MEPFNSEGAKLSNKSPLLKICPTCSPIEGTEEGFQVYIEAAQKVIDSILPKEASLEEILSLLPIVKHSYSQRPPYTIAISVISPSAYTHGMGRYVTDMLSRWLIPGKQLPIIGGINLNFYFAGAPRHHFFLHHELASIEEGDFELAKKNALDLLRELKINIQAVYHARYIVARKHLTLDQKQNLIQEHISSLLNLQCSDAERNIYDQMQGFLNKLLAEEKLTEVKKNIAFLWHSRPKIFDRSVFYEMMHYTALFLDPFIAQRSSRHISRIIALQYLFKKILFLSIQKLPQERHISVKVICTSLQAKPILAILVAMNLLKETERFDKKHLIEAIQSCLPSSQYVPNSFLADKRDESIRFFYLEIENASSFSREQIQLLRTHLSSEIHRQIENVIHPIFMPRNEEEILRNTVILSKQIRYPRDLPQVIISFESQSDGALSFLAILVRLLKEGTPPIRELFKKLRSFAHWTLEETRIVGRLKQKYPKEASLLRISLDKSPYFRKDYSLDLQRARQKIAAELTQIFGEFRDYNGGMIRKQEETLSQLRQLLSLPNSHQEFLLENLFYSIRPGAMQGIHSVETLKSFFLLLLETIKSSEISRSPSLKTTKKGNCFLAMICGASESFKDFALAAIAKLEIDDRDLCQSFFHREDTSVLGFILRSGDLHVEALFSEALQSALMKWKEAYLFTEQARTEGA